MKYYGKTEHHKINRRSTGQLGKQGFPVTKLMFFFNRLFAAVEIINSLVNWARNFDRTVRRGVSRFKGGGRLGKIA